MEEIEKATGLVGFMVLGGPELRCSGKLNGYVVRTSLKCLGAAANGSQVSYWQD